MIYKYGFFNDTENTEIYTSLRKLNDEDLTKENSTFPFFTWSSRELKMTTKNAQYKY